MSVPRAVIPLGWLNDILGLHWPESDEDRLRQLGQAWLTAAHGVVGAAGHGNLAASDIDKAVQSPSSEEFAKLWQQYAGGKSTGDGGLDQLAQQCAELSRACEDAALSTEATKWQMNVQAVIIYTQFIIAVAKTFMTGGLLGPEAAVEEEIERRAALRVMAQLKRAFWQAMLFNTVPDMVSHVAMLADGHYRGGVVDWFKGTGTSLAQDIEHSLVQAPLFAFPGIAKEKGWHLPAGLGQTLDNPVLNSPLGQIGKSAVHGALSNVAAGAITWGADKGLSQFGIMPPPQGGPLSGWQAAAGQGAFMGGFFHGVSQIHENLSTPTAQLLTTDGHAYSLLDASGHTVDPSVGTQNPMRVYSHGTDPGANGRYVGQGVLDPSGQLKIVSPAGAEKVVQASTLTTLDHWNPTGTHDYAAPASGGAPDPNAGAGTQTAGLRGSMLHAGADTGAGGTAGGVGGGDVAGSSAASAAGGADGGANGFAAKLGPAGGDPGLVPPVGGDPAGGVAAPGGAADPVGRDLGAGPAIGGSAIGGAGSGGAGSGGGNATAGTAGGFGGARVPGARADGSVGASASGSVGSSGSPAVRGGTATGSAGDPAARPGGTAAGSGGDPARSGATVGPGSDSSALRTGGAVGSDASAGSVRGGAVNAESGDDPAARSGASASVAPGDASVRTGAASGASGGDSAGGGTASGGSGSIPATRNPFMDQLSGTRRSGETPTDLAVVDPVVTDPPTAHQAPDPAAAHRAPDPAAVTDPAHAAPWIPELPSHLEQALADGAPTDAGLSLHTDPAMRDAAAQVAPDPHGAFTLDAEGSAGHVLAGDRPLTARDAADLLRDPRSGWRPGQDVRLLSCDTGFGGDTSFAADLARELGVTVTAPDSPVWTDENGTVFATAGHDAGHGYQPDIPPTGGWHEFHPDGTHQPAGDGAFPPGEAGFGAPAGRSLARGGDGPAVSDAEEQYRRWLAGEDVTGEPAQVSRADINAQMDAMHEAHAAANAAGPDSGAHAAGPDLGTRSAHAGYEPSMTWSEHARQDGVDLSAAKPEEAAAFYRDVLDARVREVSATRETSADDEEAMFVAERVLARVLAHVPDGWVLKGGLAEAARSPLRITDDIDITRKVRPGEQISVDQIKREFREALQRPHNAERGVVGADGADHLVFEEVRGGQIPNGYRFRLKVSLGGRVLVERFVADVTYQDHEITTDRVSPAESLVLVSGSDEPRQIEVLSRDEALANKIAGMFTAEDGAMTRAKDLPDIAMMAATETFDGPTAHEALHKELARRIAKLAADKQAISSMSPMERADQRIREIRLPDAALRADPNTDWRTAFESPGGSAWSGEYTSRATRVKGFELTDMADGVPVVGAFIGPLLSDHPPTGRWDPAARAWIDGVAQSGVEPAADPAARGAVDPHGTSTAGSAPASVEPAQTGIGSETPVAERLAGHSQGDSQGAGAEAASGNKFAALLGGHDPALPPAGHDVWHTLAGSHDAGSAAHTADQPHDAVSWDPASRPEDHFDFGSQLDWAQNAFDAIGHAEHDVDAIHAAVGDIRNPDGTPKYSREDIQQVKNHLFLDTHHLDDGNGGTEERRFDADPDVVQSWLRLADGTPEPHDLLLVDHELAEAAAHAADPSITHEEAHRRANLVADYESTLPQAERQALYDYTEGNNGDPGVLREGGRGPADDPLSLGRNAGRDGPGTGPGEGDGPPAAGTRTADDPAHGRRPQDLPSEGDHGHVAGPGDDRELGGPGAGHDGVEPADGSGLGRPFQSGGVIGRRRGSEEPRGREESAPFRHRQLVAIDRKAWNERATAFEQAMGAADFNDPVVKQSIADAVVRMREVLVILNDPHPGESRADFEQRVESVFFRQDPTSAGNVGFDVTFAELLEQGDSRELMTALWNAAYINAKDPTNSTETSSAYDVSYLNASRDEVFSSALLRAAESGGTDRLRQAGIDPEPVAELYSWLDTRTRDIGRRLELSRLGKLITGPKDQFIFAKDFFSTSSVVLASGDRVRTTVVTAESKLGGMNGRSDDAQRELAHTAQDYADMNVPLGELSKRYVQQHMDGPIDDPTVKLPWREGLALHDKDNHWTRAVQAVGMTTVDGVSPTTTKMLLVSDFLGFDQAHQERFAKGLMGWMLPGRDHSLYEIAVGAQMVGVGPLRGRPVRMETDPVAFYQRSLDWHGQTGAALDLAVPHREHYVDLIERGLLTELTQNSDLRGEVPDLVRSVRQQLTSGNVTDIVPGEKHSQLTTLHSWLERHGVDPNDPAAVQAMAERIPEAYLYAIGAYTLHMHPFMTAAVTVHETVGFIAGGHGEVVSRTLFNRGMNSYIDHYLDELAAGKFPARLPMAVRHVFHTGDRLNPGSPRTHHLQRWLDAHQRVQDALADPRTSPSEMKALTQSLALARRFIGERVKPHLPKLFDEVLVHCDMLQGALTNLPTIGRPDQPVWTFRGDGMDFMARLRYGLTSHDIVTARQFISTSLEHRTALFFVKETNPVYVAYRLTGEYARDISAFTVYKDTPEVLLPLGALTRRVTDPDLIDEAREQLPWDRLDPATRIIVMEEVPRG